ncbi:hypothetical protein [Sorangium cellulosum]|uniref:Uncharacterized protein n=1 Tax=Sorangium cellulosum TaxID=56 RepID=A0A150R016_SORCE|nr:hypothetical protein [Sorangium cellulosum]KYF73522.1 hypothetical protein BE15_15770 [Sorangium cellulosum]
MDGAERLLAWFHKTLARHQPDDALSFTEAQARFISVLTGLIAVERGGGMVFGMVLSGEHVDALVRAALPALAEAAQAWRAYFERRHGARGRQEVARIAADLRYAPFLDRDPLRADPAVDEALAQLVDACLDPRGAAPGAARLDDRHDRLDDTLRSALVRGSFASSAPRAGWSVAVKAPSADRRREVAEVEARHGALHPQIEALYASIDGLALLDSGAAPSRVPWPAALPPAAVVVLSPLERGSVVRKSSSSSRMGEMQLLTLGQLPGHIVYTESDRGVEREHSVALYLAVRVGTAEIYMTAGDYSSPVHSLAPDLVSFLRALRGAAPRLDGVLAALVEVLGGRAWSSR